MRRLAEADGVRRTRQSLSFTDPDRGSFSVDVAKTYDADAQVTRGTWYLSTDSEPDFAVTSLEIRSIFPQELPLLLSLGGLELVERFRDWSGSPFAVDAPPPALHLRMTPAAAKLGEAFSASHSPTARTMKMLSTLAALIASVKSCSDSP